jgi:hypothetical protein
MTENQKQPQSDEIDLSVLFSKIGDFFKNIGMGFIRFLAVLRRIPLENKTIFILVIVASIALGYVYGELIQKTNYESSMILSSEYLNKRLVDNTIDKLNLLAREKDKRGLAKVLGISDTLADNIVEFTAKPFVDENDLIEMEVLKEQLKNAQETSKNEKVIEQVINRIEIENRHAFEITVKTLNPTVIGNLQIALVRFFRETEYVRKRIEIQKITLQARKVKLLKESDKMDSLKKVIYENYKEGSNTNSQRQGSSTSVILSDKTVTPLEVYTQDLDIYNEIQSIDRSLYIQPDFEVVDGFTEFSEPSSASLAKIIIIAILIGILLSYILIALFHFNQYLARLDVIEGA